MAPETAQEFQWGCRFGFAGEFLRASKCRRRPIWLKNPEQSCRNIMQHDPRVAALCNQLGDDLSETLVTVGNTVWRVVIPLAGVPPACY